MTYIVSTYRPEVNTNFYGEAVSPMKCLSGEIDPPFAANCLYEALYASVDYLVEKNLMRPENSLEKSDDNIHDAPTEEPPILGRGVKMTKKKKKGQKERTSTDARQSMESGLLACT